MALGILCNSRGVWRRPIPRVRVLDTPGGSRGLRRDVHGNRQVTLEKRFLEQQARPGVSAVAAVHSPSNRIDRTWKLFPGRFLRDCSPGDVAFLRAGSRCSSHRYHRTYHKPSCSNFAHGVQGQRLLTNTFSHQSRVYELFGRRMRCYKISG